MWNWDSVDLALFRLVNDLAGRWAPVDELFRFLANDYIVPTSIVAILVIGWYRGETEWRRTVIHAILAMILANVTVKLLNVIWFRPRPFTFNEVNLLFYYPSDSTFPSNSAAAVWSVAWVVWRHFPESWLGKIAIALALLMGFSRVWVGVHYPLDIAGGMLVAFMAAILVERNRKRLRFLIEGLERLAKRLALA